MTESRIGIGDVIITLPDPENGALKEYVLRPTLNAALSISRQAGGIRGAIDAVLKMDLDVIVRTIQLGLGVQTARLLKDLPERVWQAGLTDDQGQLAAKCVEYLHVLANGGKPIERKEEDTENPPVS